MGGIGSGLRPLECPGMVCPACKSESTRVRDSRPAEAGTIRRRRRCLACQKRFTTYEVVSESLPSPKAVEAATRAVRMAIITLQTTEANLATLGAAIELMGDR